MKCLYCQQELPAISRPDSVVAKAICHQCHTVFRFHHTAIISITWTDIKIRERDYCVKMWWPFENSPEVPKIFEVFDIWVDLEGDGFPQQTPIMSFLFIPNWTPQNVHHKLTTYLPFL